MVHAEAIEMIMATRRKEREDATRSMDNGQWHVNSATDMSLFLIPRTLFLTTNQAFKLTSVGFHSLITLMLGLEQVELTDFTPYFDAMCRTTASVPDGTTLCDIFWGYDDKEALIPD